MRRTRYLMLLLAIYFVFIGGSSRYITLYQVRVMHHIVVTGILGLWLIQRIRKHKGIPTTSINYPLYALIGVWFISATFSLDPRMALEHIWFPFTYIILFFIVVDYFQRGRGKVIMETFFFVSLIVVFLTGLELASWYFGWGIIPGTSIGWVDVDMLIPPFLPKIALAMGISTLVAGFTVPAIFISATWAMTVRHKSHRWILWIITSLLFLTLVLTFSRGGLLAFLGGLAVFFILRGIQHPTLTSRVSTKLIGGVGGIIALSLMLGFVGLTLPYAIGRSDQGRLDMWQSAVEMTVDHPITGVGPGLFGRAYREYRDPIVGRDKLAAAHNAYLNLSSELGILGLLVGGWLGYSVLRGSWQTWKQAKGRHQHLRVEGLVAALSGLAVHSTVDVFTITPINLLAIIIVAYLITGHRSILDPLPEGQHKPTYVLLVITLLFGGLLINWDRAQGFFQSSFGKPYAEALELTRQAQAIDPFLNLYHLHEAFLLGQSANDPDEFDAAITAYENVLQLEPTWDTGWINLAWLEIQRGNVDIALDYLQHASDIYPQNSASFAYAHIAEINDATDDDAIIAAYNRAHQLTTVQPPLASVWWRTPLATQSSEAYLERTSLELKYRIARVYRPELVPELIPEDPETAQEWWVVGQVALENNNRVDAEHAFSNAINLTPSNGDYYVARAQSRLDQPELALKDLNLATLYGTTYEFPNTIRALLANDDETALSLKANALPIQSQTQEFAGVLYTRPAVFDVPREMRSPGLGERVLQPWYEVANTFVEEGNIEGAVRSYTFILENAPYEQRAQAQLNQLLHTDS